MSWLISVERHQFRNNNLKHRSKAGIYHYLTSNKLGLKLVLETAQSSTQTNSVLLITFMSSMIKDIFGRHIKIYCVNA